MPCLIMTVLNGNVHARISPKNQKTKKKNKKTLDVAFHDVLDKYDLVGCVKELIVTRNNLVVAWEVQPQMVIIS
jgi:hypothetical protein